MTPRAGSIEKRIEDAHRWFILRGPREFPKDCIRCRCGATFPGFISWSRHLMSELEAAKSRAL